MDHNILPVQETMDEWADRNNGSNKPVRLLPYFAVALNLVVGVMLLSAVLAFFTCKPPEAAVKCYQVEGLFVSLASAITAALICAQTAIDFREWKLIGLLPCWTPIGRTKIAVLVCISFAATVYTGFELAHQISIIILAV